MESERDEELRVLFAAAEKGRADIINTVVAALAAKPGRGATATATPVSAEEEYADRRKLLSSLRESDGASALHVASINGHVDAARALLRLGAAPEVRGAGPLRGLTAWDVAPTTVKQAYANDLFSQVACGEKSRAMALLKAGVRPNVTDGGPSADTPLHWAASFGHADLCSLLLNEGADINRCNNEGTTPLHEGSKGGHGDVVRLLLEQGADPEIAGTGGAFKDKTPVEMSISEAVSDIFQAAILDTAPQVMLGNGSSDGSNAAVGRAVGRTPGPSTGAPQRLAAPPPPPPPPPLPPPQANKNVQTSDVRGVLNRRHSSIGSDIVRDSSLQALLPRSASSGGSGGDGVHGGAGPSGPGGPSGAGGPGEPGGVSWAPLLRNDLGHDEGAVVGGSGHYGVSNGGTGVNGQEGARGVDRERSAPRPGESFDGVDGHGAGGGGGGLGVEEEGKAEEEGRALPMLWPPPRACTVLRDESCLVPSQIVVVLPAGGVAGPGTLTLRTLLAAFTSHGVEARCTRGRCPPGSGNAFFVALSCVTSWAKGGGGGGQGFSLVAGPGMVRVSGTGEPGLLYGVRTLCQILSIYASRPAKESVLRIPCCIIRDEPDVSRRSLIVDVRYPLLPTLPSLMRTVEVASRARMNVIQLTVTRETACWLAGHEEHAPYKTAGNDGSSEESFSPRTVGRDVGNDREGRVWGWGSLGELEAFCREHFVELVLGWAVVAGDESRDAQRTTLQLLSSLSRQFQSDEIHITFDENVRLEWEGGHTTSRDRPHRDGPQEPVISQNAENGGENPYTGARGGTQRSLSATGVGVAEHDEPNGRRAGGDTAGGDQGLPSGVLPRLSPLSSETRGTSALSSGTSVAAREEGLLLLTRFLSNVIVACGQGTIVLDGVPPAAIASLQGAGYLPVDLAFSLGGEALSDHRVLRLLSGDGVINGRSDELSMLLGPAYPGYVCTGHWGCVGGRREEACLSIHGALDDVARGVAVARRVGCGVQVRPRTVLLPTPPATHHGRATASSSSATTTTTTTGATIPGCSGANPYYPALLSDALTFVGGGLCWGLAKASAAANLSPPPGAGTGEGSGGVAGNVVSEEADSRGEAGRGDPAVEASVLRGKPSAALLLMTHMLRIDVGEVEAASAMQLSRCLDMLLEEWSPSAPKGVPSPHHDEGVTIVRKMDAVLWGVHAPGGDGSLRFCVSGSNRFLLRSLQRRHLELQQVSKLAIQGLQASQAPCAGGIRSLLMEVLRTARLLKLSGRFLQTICLHVRGPSPGVSIEYNPGDGRPASPLILSPRASGPRRSRAPIHRRNSSENMPHFNWHSGSEGIDGNESIGEGTLQELVARLPVTVRLDFANRYLEEFRDLARAWNSAAYLPSGRALLHGSLSGAMAILAHDTPAAQMDELCKSAIYNS